MHRYLLLIFGLVVLAFQGNAQNPIIIEGKISDSEKNEPVPYVHIINKTTGKGTNSKLDGYFKIESNVNDTLIFSAIGYAKHYLKITKELKGIYVNISMDVEAMELKPVRVFAYKDLESLKRAIVKLDVPAEESKGFDLQLPPPTSLPDSDGGGAGIGMTGLLTGAINGLGLNKEYNEQVKLQKFQQEEQRRKIAGEKFNKEVVRKWTGLEGEALDAFMEFCKLSDDFIVESSEYELAVSVHQCMEEFKLK